MIRPARVLVLSLLLLSSTARAQTVSGRVVLKGGGPAGVEVILHRVRADTASAVDLDTTGPGGAFHLRAASASDPEAVLFATARYLGVQYFGPPLHRGAASDHYRIVVFDTADVAGAPTPVRFSARDLLLLPQPEGGWDVNEIIRVHNPTRHTLVSTSGLPVWEALAPPGAVGLEIGSAGIRAEGVSRMGSRLLGTDPLLPGRHELLLRYRLPASPGGLHLRSPTATDTLRVHVRQPSPELRPQGLAPTQPLDLGGDRFLRFQAVALKPNQAPMLVWDAPVALPVSPVQAGTGVAALLLAVGTAAAIRGAKAPKAPSV